jgi:hypothetical protein
MQLATPPVSKEPNEFRTLLLLGLAVISLLTLLVSLEVESHSVRDQRFQSQLNQLQAAALNYHVEYGHYPHASNNAALMQILTGAAAEQNSRHIPFLDAGALDLTSSGELLGPGHTPLQLSITSEGIIHLRCAGPDQIFGTRDDVAVDDKLYLSN